MLENRIKPRLASTYHIARQRRAVEIYGCFKPFCKVYEKSLICCMSLKRHYISKSEPHNAKILRVSGFFRGSNNITNERIITMEDNKKNQEAMPAKNVRLRVDQWEDCDRLTKKLSLPSEKHFIRDAVDFYIEFLNAKSSSKFLTPALESVIDAKNRDSEGRINRNLYRLAVEQNHLARIIAYTYDIPDEVVKELRAQAIRDVQETNGTIHVDEIIRGN
jgi:hypothetical protein